MTGEAPYPLASNCFTTSSLIVDFEVLNEALKILLSFIK